LEVLPNIRHQTTNASVKAFKMSGGLHLVDKESGTSIYQLMNLFFWLLAGWWVVGQTHINTVYKTELVISVKPLDGVFRGLKDT